MRRQGHDGGEAGCDAYLWERADAYRTVELGSSGDVVVVNSSAEAGQLTEYLKEKLGMGSHLKRRW